MSSPSQINALHNKAMDLAGQALHADHHGEYARAESLFQEAYGLERKAALLVVETSNAEPTRSVLLRSAATLAVDCRKFREAEQLIALGLSGKPPTELIEEFRDLLEKVYFSRHLSLRGLQLDPGEFQMSLTGGAVGFGVIESSLFLRRADIAEKLLVRTMERLHKIPFRETGSPTKSVMDGFEVYFSTVRAASFAITIRLGRPERQGLLPGFIGPKEVVDELLLCLTRFNEEQVEDLRQHIESEAYFNNFTALTRKLAPDGKKVRTVGFTSVRGDETKQIALSHPATPVWQEGGSDEQHREELLGVIHKADETKKRGQRPVFGVEDEHGETRTITVPPGMLQDIVKPLWGERVKVIAKKMRGGRLELIHIEPYEPEQQTES